MKILILDIETAPKLAYVWRFWKENVSAKQVLSHGHIMSFSAKWLGATSVHYSENRRQDDDSEIAKELWGWLDQADVVVAHNGERFDLPQIMSRLIVHGIHPPSPYKIVDTVKVARKEFGFGSNSLEYLAKVLGCTEKKSHKKFPGFELWVECMKGNEAAWKEMKDYNIQDVVTLEEIYFKMRPYIRNHPNAGVFSEEETCVCPKCGGGKLHWRGYTYTQVSKYRRFQCQDCGGWGRSRFTENSAEKRKNLLTNIQ